MGATKRTTLLLLTALLAGCASASGPSPQWLDARALCQQQSNPRAGPHCPAPPVAASALAERRGSIGAARCMAVPRGQVVEPADLAPGLGDRFVGRLWG